MIKEIVAETRRDEIASLSDVVQRSPAVTTTPAMARDIRHPHTPSRSLEDDLNPFELSARVIPDDRRPAILSGHGHRRVECLYAIALQSEVQVLSRHRQGKSGERNRHHTDRFHLFLESSVNKDVCPITQAI